MDGGSSLSVADVGGCEEQLAVKTPNRSRLTKIRIFHFIAYLIDNQKEATWCLVASFNYFWIKLWCNIEPFVVADIVIILV